MKQHQFLLEFETGKQSHIEMTSIILFVKTKFLLKGILTRDLEKAMAPHSSTLAWQIPWTEELGRLQSMGSLRVGHD